jgi:hypothetical protein
MNEAAKAIVEQTDWPKTEEAVTADALILHGSRISMATRVSTDRLFDAWNRTERDSPEWKPALKAYLDSLSAMIAEAQVVIALVEVQKTSPGQADALARRLWELTEDGGVLPELMWDYLSDRGVDAQAVWDAAEAEDREPSDSGPYRG